MRFLTDHDVFAISVRFLADLGHDVITVNGLGLAGKPDQELLKLALAERRIFLTRDRDFGNLVFVQSLAAGVIYLRMEPNQVEQVHDELKRALSLYAEDELLKSFMVVEPGRHRIRKPSVGA